MTSATPSNRPADPTGAALGSRVAGHGDRLVMAHGFTQTGQVWGSLDSNLAEDHEVVTVDMPGHGRSSEVAANLVDGAALLGAVGGRASYLGYSMGARFALHLALSQPDLVNQLILISGTAGIIDDAERQARRQADEALADRLDPRPSVPGDHSREPLSEFLRRWMDQPMFNGVEPERSGLAERLTNHRRGLASSLRLAGTGTQRPLWDRLDHLAMPVLIITGEHDIKFTELGRQMADAIGTNVVREVIPSTGHAPHLQDPDGVATLIRRHLLAR
jgi:2-succinyl-6-hydroxy-2,4-cyclohexadiene-1-carboxylate synthase